MTEQLSRLLLGVGLVALLAPALVPVQPLLYHDTGPNTFGNESQLEDANVTVIAYENLSERGQELYRRSLETNGAYGVPQGEGAPDFEYPVGDDSTDRNPRRPGPPAGAYAIERPGDDESLPPADERQGAAEGIRPGGNESNESQQRRQEQLRQRIARYDLMTTRTAPPPITDGSNLGRLLSVLVGIVAIGTGGYLESRP